MKTYRFELTGLTPLLMHADDVEAADQIAEIRNKLRADNKSVAGDDRSPPDTWKSYMYRGDGKIVMPTDNLRTLLVTAGALVQQSGRRTYKKETQSMMAFCDVFFPLIVKGKEVDASKVDAVAGTFSEQASAVKQFGFELFVKRARVGASKHIRVRPRFGVWALAGTFDVFNEAILPRPVVEAIWAAATRCGLGDWRPTSPKSPGPFGRVEAKVMTA